MKVRCFDCNRNDWMVRFHHTSNRSFCDQCYQKRIQPERSKREDSVLHDIPEWGANAPLNFEEWQRRCGALNTMET